MNKLTYGEAWYQSKIDIFKQDSFEAEKKHREHQERMNREDASKHYNKKLFDYWLSMLEGNIKIENKKRWLSALMFGNTEAYKIKIGVN